MIKQKKFIFWGKCLVYSIKPLYICVNKTTNSMKKQLTFLVIGFWFLAMADIISDFIIYNF